jgi:adenylyltransferase/sulfurtransferase
MNSKIDFDAPQSRYDRQERITWWNQDALLNSKVLVVGAGALGNEIVKNLALLGIGEIQILDMDSIERSNLARCALFRDHHQGQPKATSLADSASSINPDCKIIGHVMSVQEFGSASLMDFDLIIAGLDNLEARLWLNKAARHINKLWIDGAIEGLQGIVRVFPPSGACLECTLSEQDHVNLSHRRSCALLTPEELNSGKTPTNSTSASVVAGLEVQEAVKYIVGRHDLLALNNKVWRLDGETMMTSVMGFFEDEYCLSHDTYENISEEKSAKLSWTELFESYKFKTGESVEAVDFEDDILVISKCPACLESKPLYGLRSLLPAGAGKCLACKAELDISSTSSFSPNDLEKLPALDSWYWPLSEFITLRSTNNRVHQPIRKERSK